MNGRPPGRPSFLERIKMAWNRPNELKAPPKKDGSAKLIAFLSLGAIAAAIGIALFCFGNKSTIGVAKHDKNKAIPSAVPLKTKQGSNAIHKAFAKTGDDKLDAALANFERVEPPAISRPNMPPVPDHYTNHWFKSGTEQVMSWIFTTQLGDCPMPIPRLTDEERKNLVADLMSPNEINDSDDDMTKYAKEMVNTAKKEMMQYIHDGGDPDDFLQYYYDELNKAHQYRMEAINQGELVFEEDPELAKDFVGKVNERLAEQGIREISIKDFE